MKEPPQQTDSTDYRGKNEQSLYSYFKLDNFKIEPKKQVENHFSLIEETKTCQILNCKIYSVSDFESKSLQRVRFRIEIYTE